MKSGWSYHRLVPLIIGVMLGAWSCYTFYATLFLRNSYTKVEWSLFLGTVFAVAALAAVFGAILPASQLAASLSLAFATGSLAALGFLFVFSLGLLLWPLAGVMATIALRNLKEIKPANPRSLLLAALVPAVLVAAGFGLFYR